MWRSRRERLPLRIATQGALCLNIFVLGGGDRDFKRSARWNVRIEAHAVPFAARDPAVERTGQQLTLRLDCRWRRGNYFVGGNWPAIPRKAANRTAACIVEA